MTRRILSIAITVISLSVCLLGSGPAAAQTANLSPTSMAFGGVVVGATSSRNLKITNTGTSSLIITSIAASVNFQSSNCGSSTLTPNSSCTVSVSFTPPATGSFTGTLTITDNAFNSPQVVNLSGSGVLAVTFSPASLSFPNQAIGMASAPKTLTLVNNQAVSLTITSVTTTGNFTASGCPATLAAQASCVISVTFTPSVLGTNQGTLTVTDSANNSPQTASLTGSAVQPVAFNQTSLTFGNQVVNTASAAKTVTLANNQSLPLNISSITTTSSFAASSCATPIAPGGTCVINVTFTPATTGSLTGTLAVADDASTSPQTVSLSGTGILAVSLSPTTLQFSTQAVGSTSAAKTTVLTNSQSTSLSVTSVSTTGPFAASTCPASIAPSGTCTISVTFTPSATGQVIGTLTVVDSAGNSPQTATLQGTGAAATLTSITVSPANPSAPAGTTQAFTATGNYNNGTTANLTTSVTWSSSATKVATINSAGVATALAAGTATITATSASISGSATLTVSPPALVSLAVTPVNLTLAPSGTQQFTATGTYTDGSTQNLTGSVSWSSGNSAVAIINAAGLATGVAPGNTAITVVSGSIAGSANLTVGNPPTLVSIAVTPVSLNVALGGSQQFTATGTYSDGSTQSLAGSALSWTTGGVAGGNAVMGTVSGTGLYTAPGTLPNPAQVTLVATSTSTPSVSGSTMLTVVGVTVTVSPTTAQVPGGATQQFTATVTGPTNTSVTWSAGGVVGGNSTVGTISTTGLYTAPNTVPNPAQVTITATSAADGLTSASATVTVVAKIGVAILPSTNLAVPINSNLQFTATVTGTSNTAVTWSVGGLVGGNIIVGTITASGLYTGPPIQPDPAHVLVTATSVADPTKSASEVILVEQALNTVSVVVSPVNLWVQTGQTSPFSVVVVGTSNTAVTWSVNGVVGGDLTYGTISTSGLYTAPSAVPEQLPVVVTATSVAAPAKSASGSVTIATTPFSATPLVDFTPGQLYLGQFSGMLYDGSNSAPADQIAAGMAAAAAVQPLDINGNPSASGKIGLISLGMSEAYDEWCDGSSCTSYSFTGQAASNSGVNHSTLVILDGATSGTNTTSWVCPYGDCPLGTTAPNWYDRVLNDILIPAGVTEAQVQVVWIQEANPGPTWFPTLPSSSADAYAFEYYLGQVLHALKIRWPNVQQVFISSRIYAGYANTNQSPEPYAYEYGFGVKRLINQQMLQRDTGAIDPFVGDLLTGVPWIDWGPYLWGNDSNNLPGSSALNWAPDDFSPDGIHPSSYGVTQVGGALLNFFLNSPSTPWFRN